MSSTYLGYKFAFFVWDMGHLVVEAGKEQNEDKNKDLARPG